jgi:hypothetical protein
MKEEDSQILTQYSKEEKGTCIICNVRLIRIYDSEKEKEETPEFFALKCPKCKKDYFPRYEMVKHEEEFGGIHDDVNELLETEGIGIIDEGGILLSSEEDNRFFPKQKKDTDYLKKHFGNHVDITTREE